LEVFACPFPAQAHYALQRSGSLLQAALRMQATA